MSYMMLTKENNNNHPTKRKGLTNTTVMYSNINPKRPNQSCARRDVIFLRDADRTQKKKG